MISKRFLRAQGEMTVFRAVESWLCARREEMSKEGMEELDVETCHRVEYLFLSLCKGEENIDVHMERLTIQALELVRCKI